MSNAESEFRILLTGEILAGFERETVVEGLSRLLKISVPEAQGLLSGERSRIRKTLTLEKAERLRDKLLARGAGCELEVIIARAANEDKARVSAGSAASESQAEPGFSGLTLDLDDEGSAQPPEPKNQLPDEPEEIVLESRPLSVGSDDGLDLTQPMPALDLSENQGAGQIADQESEAPAEDSGVEQFYAAPGTSGPSSGKSSAKLPGNARHKQFLLLGLLLVLVVAGGFFYFSSGSLKKPRLEKPVTAVAPPLAIGPKAKTEQKLENLVRQVRLWMIQYGDGFDPSQVTLNRLVEDLDLSPQLLRDDWGGAIEYQVDGDLYRLVSPGADGEPGTADDLSRQAKAR